MADEGTGTSSTQGPAAEAFKPDFNQIAQTYALQALMGCGLMENPANGKREKDLLMARYHIGVLEVLEEKTRGNLTPAETQALTEVLHQVRMAYMQSEREGASQPESQPQAAGATQPAGDDGGEAGADTDPEPTETEEKPGDTPAEEQEKPSE